MLTVLLLQLQDLICQILQGHLIIFNKKETFLSILSKFLHYEYVNRCLNYTKFLEKIIFEIH